MYGTISYTTQTGKDYEFTFETRDAFVAAMRKVQANRENLKTAAFKPIVQPAKAKQPAFGKVVTRAEWLAMKAAKPQECTKLWDCTCQECMEL